MQARIKQLRKEIEELSDLYYNKNISKVSDAKFDALMEELKEIEKAHPELIESSSPTQTVGAPLKDSHFKTFPHLTPMLSLDNALNIEELDVWLDSLTVETENLVVEYKADGVSLDLIYKDGILVQALTRGDGITGEDVTLNAKHIKDLPHTLVDDAPGIVNIRGEVVITRDDFKAINDALVDTGNKPYANERNYASGSLRQKNSEVTKNRKLRFLAYSVDVEHVDSTLHEYEFFYDNGFTGPKAQPTIWKMLEIDPTLEYHRQLVEYSIDGLVFKVMDHAKRKEIGSTSRFPKWAIAYKFPASKGVSTLEDVQWQIGRTGVLTPVAQISPVLVHGVIVSNVTLHNLDEINRLGLTMGASVLVERAGDVIPKITEVMSKTKEAIQTPILCPSCKDTVVMIKRANGGSDPHCLNRECPDRQIQHLLYCTSRGVFDIKGLGIEYITLLVKEGILKASQPFRLLTLTKSDFTKVDISEHMSEKLAQSVQTALGELTLPKVYRSLGIPHVATGTSERLSKVFTSMDRLSTASVDDLLSIPDVGVATAASIYQYFQDQKKLKEEDSVMAHSIILASLPEIIHVDETKLPLFGNSVLISGGDFNGQTRKEVTEYLKSLGAKVVSKPSRNTRFAVMGHKHSKPKLESAQQLGVFSVLLENNLVYMDGESLAESENCHLQHHIDKIIEETKRLD